MGEIHNHGLRHFDKFSALFARDPTGSISIVGPRAARGAEVNRECAITILGVTNLGCHRRQEAVYANPRGTSQR